MSNVLEIPIRSVRIPLNRQNPLKAKWEEIVKVLTNQLLLQSKVVITAKPWLVEMRSPTKDDVKLQKGVDLLNAFAKGFDFIDCLSMVRMDGLYIRTLYVKEAKRTLKGDHLTRGIGRVCGANGVMRKKVENATMCRLVVTDNVIHIMGSFQATDAASRLLTALLKGAPVNKVTGRLGKVKHALD